MTEVRRLGFSIGWNINTRPLVEADRMTDRYRDLVRNTTSDMNRLGFASRHSARDISVGFRGATIDIDRTADTTDRTEREMDQLRRTTRQTTREGSRGFSLLNSTASKLAATIGGFVSIGAITMGFKGMIEQASIAEEQSSKFGVVFGNLETQTRRWAEETSETIGRSKLEIEGFLADVQNMLVGFGATREQGAELSKQIIQLGYDLASFNNLADDRAIENLSSALLGNHEAAKSLGAVLNETTLALQMERMGLEGKFQDLDELTKIQVRYNTVLAQSQDAIGDAERTSGSYANQLKALKGEIRDMSAELGAKLIPEATKFIRIINENMPDIKNTIDGFISFTIKSFNTLDRALKPVGETIGAIFNVFRGGDFGTFRIEGVMKLKEIFGEDFGNLIIGTVDLIRNDLIPAAIEVGSKAFKAIGEGVKFVKEHGDIIIPILGGIASSLLAFKGINKVLEIKEMINNFGGLAGIIGQISTKISGAIAFITSPVGIAVVAIGALVTAGILLYKNWDKIKDFAGELWETIKEKFTAIGVKIVSVFEGVKTKLASIWNGITGTIKTGINLAIKGINFFVRGMNKISIDVPDWADKIPGVPDELAGKMIGFNIPEIPMLAKGTNNFPGGSAIVGEEGPELVTLPRGAQVTPYKETKDILNRRTTRNLTPMNVEFKPYMPIYVQGGSNPEETAKVTRQELERLFPDLIEEFFSMLARKKGLILE